MPGKKKSKGKKGGKSTKSSGGATKGGYADPFAPSDEIPPPPKPGESVSRAKVYIITLGRSTKMSN